MGFVPNASAAEFPSPTKKGRFVPNDEKSLGGFGENLVEDVKGTAKGLGNLAEGMMEHPIDTSVGVAKNIVPGVIEEGKRLGVGELLTGHPVNAINKLGNAAYNKPLTTAMSVIPAAGAVGKVAGAGMKALRGAGLAEEAALAAAKGAVKEAPAALGADDMIQFGKGGGGKSATMEAAEDFANNPPKPPPTGAAPTPPVDPLAEVKNFVTKKYGQAAEKPGFTEKAGKYLKNEVADLRGKDIGLRDPMIRSLDPKNPLKALDKAEGLMDYAAENGYFKPGLTDISRKEAIKAKIADTGKNIGAVRELGGQRGMPPIAEVRQAIKNELVGEYGNKAMREIKTVLADFDRKVKDNPTFQGLSDVATYLNGEKKTFNKIGQNAGPTTDAANIISRMNNEALRKVLSPEENNFYTQNLRDFGAHKKLEQMVASSSRRAMTGRGAPGGALSALWQQMWDRGGYRMAGNIADRMGSSMVKNPGKFKTLPDFFEEFAHHSGDVLDEALDITPSQMAHGGIAGAPDLNNFLASKYGKPKEK